MMKNKKAFVLLETIVVISVLCVILIVLYASYSKVLIDVNKRSTYDNTEYIYKTELLRSYLESSPIVASKIGDEAEAVVVYCSNTLDTEDDCDDSSVIGHELFTFLKVNSVYFTLWNIDALNERVLELEPTTQNYIKTIDAVDKGPVYRLIVMYKSENDELTKDYEYASLIFRIERLK